jgi:uncharacterized membrane protein HdeD (DUF308 family)
MATGIHDKPLAFELRALEHNWGWFVALGIAEIVLGSIAIGAAVLTTIVSMTVFGWLLVIGGVLSIVHAFWQKQWGGFFIDMVVGLLYAVAGSMVASSPALAAVTLTLLISLLLVMAGAFRIAIGAIHHSAHRGWLLLSGVISLALGMMIWNQWPVSGLWVIGLFIGIEMIFYGWSLAMLGMAAQDLSERRGSSPSA